MDPKAMLNDKGRRPPEIVSPSLSRLEKALPNRHQEPVAPRGQKRRAEDALTPSSRTPKQVAKVDHSHRAAVKHPDDVGFRLRSRGSGLVQQRCGDRRKVIRFDTLSEDRSSGERQILLCAISNLRAVCPPGYNATERAMSACRSKSGEVQTSDHSSPAQTKAKQKDSKSHHSLDEAAKDAPVRATDHISLPDGMQQQLVQNLLERSTSDETDPDWWTAMTDMSENKNLQTDEEHSINDPITITRTPSTTHPYHMPEAFFPCERTDYLQRGIWTWYGLNGSKDHPTSPPVEVYLVCNHGNCRRIDWKTVHGLHRHLVKNHQQPKESIGGLEKALATYGVPVRNIEEYESQHGLNTDLTSVNPWSLRSSRR